MEDYIYILLGLVWIIYAAYRSNQKKKKARETPVTPEPLPVVTETDTEFSSMLDEFFGTKTPQEEAPVFAQTEPDYRNVEEQHGFYNKNIKTEYKLDSIPDEEGVSVFDENDLADFFGQSSISEDYEDSFVHKTLDFDLRKAIIFSEILNRPNF